MLKKCAARLSKSELKKQSTSPPSSNIAEAKTPALENTKQRSGKMYPTVTLNGALKMTYGLTMTLSII